MRMMGEERTAEGDVYYEKYHDTNSEHLQNNTYNPTETEEPQNSTETSLKEEEEGKTTRIVPVSLPERFLPNQSQTSKENSCPCERATDDVGSGNLSSSSAGKQSIPHSQEKARIRDLGQAIQWLRQEMLLMKEQDKELIKTFMNLGNSIDSLKRIQEKGFRPRSYSSDLIDDRVRVSSSYDVDIDDDDLDELDPLPDSAQFLKDEKINLNFSLSRNSTVKASFRLRSFSMDI